MITRKDFEKALEEWIAQEDNINQFSSPTIYMSPYMKEKFHETMLEYIKSHYPDQEIKESEMVEFEW